MRNELNIFEFNDYRSFLSLYVQREKKRFTGFSYELWSKKLGLKDKSSISKIVQGHRLPGERTVEKLIHYFSFNQKESNYFRDLVRLHRLQDDPFLASQILQKLEKVYRGESPRQINNQTFLTISNWYTLVIKEMLNIPAFKNDPQWIANKLRFKVTATLISQAIKNLLESGLIINVGEQLQAAGKRLNFGDQGLCEAIKNYHEENLENAKQAIRSVPLEERDISSSLFCMSYSNIPRAKELIRQFKKDFCQLMEEPGGEAIFQIQIQFLPLTFPEKKQ